MTVTSEETRAAVRGQVEQNPGRALDKPRLLYISTFFPFPNTGGGKLRVANLLRRLACTYEVHYLSLGLSDEECSAQALVQAEPHCASITVIPHTQRRALAGLKALLTLRPYEINLFDSAELADALSRLSTTLRPDVLWFSRLSAARYLTDAGDAIAVLDQHDLTSQLWRLMQQGAPEVWVRLFAAINRQLVEWYERRIYPRFDVAVSVSEVERQLTHERILRSNPRIRNVGAPVLFTAGNGVDLEYFAPAAPAAPSATRDLVLTGTMNQRRNVDAALYFADEILPRLTAEFPRLRFVIVGKEPAREVIELGSRPGILVTGTVDDVRPWLAQAEIVVAPFRFGSGVKHKVPIAMAMQKAIVTSSNGAQGLDVVHGRHVMIADRSADFADHVATLLRNEALRAALGREARALVVERYGWDGIVAALVAQVEALRKARGVSAAA